jgi:hypothetical protein
MDSNVTKCKHNNNIMYSKFMYENKCYDLCIKCINKKCYKNFKKKSIICTECNITKFHFHCNLCQDQSLIFNKRSDAKKHLLKHSLKCLKCGKRVYSSQNSELIYKTNRYKEHLFKGVLCSQCKS